MSFAALKARFAGKSPRPTPLSLAGLGSGLLVLTFLVVGARMPSEPAAPQPSTPEQSVRMFFDLGAQHRYDEAGRLRSARLQALDPAALSVRARFGRADRLTLVQDRLVAVDRVHGRATVAVVWTEVQAGRTQRFGGRVDLVGSRAGWLWDGGPFV